MDSFIKDFSEEQVSVELINDVNTLKNSFRQNDFSILHLNICGIRGNFDEFLCFLRQIKIEIDIIVLTETHRIFNPHLFNLQDYTCIYNEGSYNKCDGIIVLIKNTIRMKQSFKFIGEVKCIELEVGENPNKFVLTCIYRSPAINEEKYVDNLTDYLLLNKTFNNHVIVGDINLNLLRRDKSFVEKYKSILAISGFTSYNKYYTRPNSKTCLDHFFVKGFGGKYLQNIKSFVINYKITDHCPILLKFEKYAPQKINDNNTRYKKYINYKQLRRDLNNHYWASVLHNADIHEATSNFIKTLQFLISKNTQLIAQSNTKNGKKGWITNEILKLIQEKNRLYNESRKNPNNNRLKTEYTDYKRKTAKIIKRSKQEYAQKLISKNQNKSSALWNCVNKICNKPRQNNKIEKIESQNSEIITDKTEIANQFNNFFCDIGENLAKNIKKPKNFQENNNWSTHSLFHFREATTAEVQKTIHSLKPNKAPGHDCIKSETLKAISDEITPIITYLINFCFNTGTFPNILKIGEIRPLFKQGSKTDINNYRPISLLSSVSKIFEKIIKFRMSSFLDKHNILSDQQFGFRAGKSTEDAILSLTSNIYKSMDKNQPSLCVFIDLTKAFDTVCHKRLIEKLERCGFRGGVLNLLKNYMTDRHQYVAMEDTKSVLRAVTCGVPQGTVLGPVLFTIYINNILQLNSQGKIISFADDTVIFYTACNWKSLRNKVEADLWTINKWFQENKLTLNKNKTKFVPFTSYVNNLPSFDDLKVEKNLIISKVDNIKYLGITIDCHLRWDKHINDLANKIRHLVTRFYFLKTYLDIKHLKQVYFALFQSHISYGIAGWGAVRDIYLNDLELIQKWVIKVIFNKNRSYSSDLLYTEAKILDIRQLYFQQLLMCINRQKIKLDTITHRHNTRQRDGFAVVPPSKKEIYHRSFLYLAPKFYNFLPNHLKAVIYKKCFKLKVKNWICTQNRAIVHNLFKIII